MATGNKFWSLPTLQCDFKIHGVAEEAGILINYQGVQRYHGILFTHGKLQIVRQYYERQILAETFYPLQEEEILHIKISYTKQGEIRVNINGKAVLSALDNTLDRGGCGFMVSHGLCGFYDLKIQAKTL